MEWNRNSIHLYVLRQAGTVCIRCARVYTGLYIDVVTPTHVLYNQQDHINNNNVYRISRSHAAVEQKAEDFRIYIMYLYYKTKPILKVYLVVASLYTSFNISQLLWVLSCFTIQSVVLTWVCLCREPFQLIIVFFLRLFFFLYFQSQTTKRNASKRSCKANEISLVEA